MSTIPYEPGRGVAGSAPQNRRGLASNRPDTARRVQEPTEYARRAPIAGPVPSLSMPPNLPGGSDPIPPTIPYEGEQDGRSIYYLISSIFDPRTTQFFFGETTPNSQRYSGMANGFDYSRHVEDLLYRIIFDTRPGRQEPPVSVVMQIVENICDISRMLGIYLTALSLKQSKDPQMFERARTLDLRDSFVEMQTILMDLPCPKFIAGLNSKFMKLMDISDGPVIQNVGFLSVGDFSVFLALYNNVRSRREALGWMRVMYPPLGNVGDPGNAYDPDVFEMFVNAQNKATATNQVIYTKVAGASDIPQMLASAGMLHTVYRTGLNLIHTVTGWVVPGSGFGANPTWRSPYSYLCKWDTVNNRDALITRVDATGPYNQALGVVTAATQLNAPLSANLYHENNINRAETTPNDSIRQWDVVTGLPLDVDQSTVEDTRYRTSAGMELNSLSYTFDANQLTLLAACLAS